MPDRFSPMSDREILVQIAGDVTMLKSAIYGDGRPGLIEVVSTNSARLKAYDEIYARSMEEQPRVMALFTTTVEKVRALETQVPSTKERKAAWAGVATAIGIALAGLIQGLTGIGLDR